MTPTIRPVEIADYASWLVLWNGYNKFYGRSGPTALPDAVTQSTWQRFFTPSEPVHALVAVVDGEVAGTAHYLFHRSTSAIDDNAYLQDLFTAEALRGRGIARALIAGVADAARVHGVNRLYWHTHETNVTAQTLYDKVAQKTGFIVYRHVG